jgi:AAA domain
MVIGSDSKAGKTWLLMDLCAAMARGEKWLGIQTRKSRVLYIDFELQKQLTRDRFRLIKKRRGYNGPSECMEILNLRGYPMSAAEFKDFLLAEGRSKKFDVIFVDPIYKLMVGMDHNAAGDVSKVLGALEEISRRINASIIYADHYAKGNSALKKAIDRIAGSGVTARDPDTMIMFTEVEDLLGAKDGRMAVEFTLRGFKPKAPFAIAKMEKSPLFEVRPDLDPTRLAGVPGPKPRATADELLAILPNEGGFSSEDWMKTAEEKLGIKKTVFYDRQKDLKNRGLIHKSELSGNWEKTAKGMGIEQKKPEDCDGPDQDPFEPFSGVRNSL